MDNPEERKVNSAQEEKKVNFVITQEQDGAKKDKDEPTHKRERSLSDQPSFLTTSQDKMKEADKSASRPAGNRERATSLIGPKEKYPNWKKKSNSDTQPRKSSSTATLFLDSTIYIPKNNDVITSMAEYFHSQIKTEFEDGKKQFAIFDERLYPLTSDKHDFKNPPPITTIEKFIKDIFRVGQLAPESLIMAVVYINRIQASAGFKFTPYNWKRMVLSALVLASKVWEDQAVWVVDFLPLFNASSSKDFGQLEKQMLALLSFDVSFKASEYSAVYFDLRAQSNTVTEHFKELQPLDKDSAEKLELKIKSFQEKVARSQKERKLSRGGHMHKRFAS